MGELFSTLPFPVLQELMQTTVSEQTKSRQGGPSVGETTGRGASTRGEDIR